MFEDRKSPGAEVVDVEGPAFHALPVSATPGGPVLAADSLFLGFEFAVAGWHKLTGTGWIDGGGALLGYWQNAVRSRAAGARARRRSPSTGTARSCRS